jgi:hypothetical protein
MAIRIAVIHGRRRRRVDHGERAPAGRERQLTAADRVVVSR